MSDVIIITGCSGKLGIKITKHFVDLGKIIVAPLRSNASIIKIKKIFRNDKNKNNIYFFENNLLNKNASKVLIKKLKKLNLKPKYLINLARDLQNLKLNTDGTVKTDFFLNEFNLQVVVPYNLSMALVKNYSYSMKCIINIGSIYGSVVPNLRLYNNFLKESPIHYGVAKSALVHLTKELAVRLAKKNIRVNCVAYGGVEGRVDNKFKEKYIKLCPSGRMISDEEIIMPIEMLLSDKASGINGHTLMVDGGWTLW